MSAQERVRIFADATPNSWLAFSQDESRVVAQGESYGQAVENAQEQGESDPVLMRVPDEWRPRVL